MKLFMMSHPSRRYAARKGRGFGKLKFGSQDPQQRRRPEDKWGPLGGDLEADLWGEDDRALCLRAVKEGKL